MRDYPYIMLSLITAACAMLAFGECGEQRPEIPHIDQYVVEPSASLFPMAFFEKPYTYATASKCGEKCIEWSFDGAVCGVTRIGTLRCDIPDDSHKLIFPDSQTTQQHRRWRP